jgi:hypothetical protein
MKHCRIPGMNKLRDRFETVEDLARVINRSRRYTIDRLNFKKPFTDIEKQLILSYLGEGTTDDIFK